MTRTSSSVTIALSSGLLLTVLATLGAVLGAGPIGDHISAGYPHAGAQEISEGVRFYTTCLVALGVLGLVGWGTALWAARRSRPLARLLSTGLLVLGAAISVAALLIRDTSGETALAPGIGAMGLAPCAAGLIAVVLLWRGSSDARESSPNGEVQA
jgi:hypothetical protein